MRRIAVLLLILALFVAFSMPALGANYASQVNVNATVNPNESCHVTVTATLHIDTGTEELTFPVPAEATSVTLNGSSWISVTRSGQAQYIDLSGVIGNMTGDFTITVQYTLPDVIHTGTAGTPELKLPLLSGYKNSISRLNFSVTLPDTVDDKPAFSSGYHQANIEKDISCTVTGNSFSGFSLTELKDHETLTVTLPVEAAMFPNAPLVFHESNTDDTAMVVCAIIALIYWIVFLRCLPPKRLQNASAPEGISAGEVGAVMTLGKADLSLMIFSWAQLGYLTMHLHKGRVILRKQMDMGNERTALEQRCFKNLFSRRDTVDTSGQNYAAQCKKVATMAPEMQSLVKRQSGNPKLFRLLAATVCLFGGISFGIAMSLGAALQGFWVFLVAVLGLLCGWFIQETTHELLLRKGHRTVTGIVFSCIWLGLGIVCGQFSLAVITMLLQWLAGLMAFFGGRRTEAGRQEFSRLVGLRHYLSTVSSKELQRIYYIDPEYFHNLIPYALALGVDKRFARRFGKAHIPDCPYIISGGNTPRTAKQWNDLMRTILNKMERRSRFLFLEKVMAFVASLKK